MRNNKRKARLGANQPGGNSRMIARARKLRVGNLVRVSPQTNRGPMSIYEWLKDSIGIVTDIHPYGWDTIANFDFKVYRVHRGDYILHNRDFGFYRWDLELVKR